MSKTDATHHVFQGTSAKPAPYRGWFAEVCAYLCRGYLALVGWKVRGDWPDLPKVVLLAAPHTSNCWLLRGLIALSSNGWAKRALLRGHLAV
jgi:hypothetical protein